VAIAGTLYGRCYWCLRSGIEGSTIRTHILRILRSRSNIMSKFCGGGSDALLPRAAARACLEFCLHLFWPAEMPLVLKISP
jgi:hypothetical protein